MGLRKRTWATLSNDDYIKVNLRSIYTYSLRPHLHQISILNPICPSNIPSSLTPMINFDSDFDRHGQAVVSLVCLHTQLINQFVGFSFLNMLCNIIKMYECICIKILQWSPAESRISQTGMPAPKGREMLHGHI